MDTAATPFVFEHPELTLSRLDTGGFALAPIGQDPIRAEPDGDGWRLEGRPRLEGWRLERDAVGGFVLCDPEVGTDESALTLASVDDGSPRFLLLEDGRMFRIRLEGPRDGRFELSGWETPGAYLVARPEKREWKISPMPASGGLPELTTIWILFAAEILEADGGLHR